jgi:hypothetical protein
MEGVETACFRIAWTSVLNKVPLLAQLYCRRCGEWVTVEMKTFKWYLTRYPYPEEIDEDTEDVFIQGGCNC